MQKIITILSVIMLNLTVAMAEVPVSGITIPSKISIEEGKSTQVIITISPDSATNQSFNITNSNTDFIKVPANGMAISGEAKITVTGLKSCSEKCFTVVTADGNHTGICCVTVTAKPPTVAVTGISFGQPTYTFNFGDENKSIKADVEPSNATDKRVIYEVVEGNSVSINENGEITIENSGETTIEAKSGNFKDTCKVVITPELEEGNRMVLLDAVNDTIVSKSDLSNLNNDLQAAKSNLSCHQIVLIVLSVFSFILVVLGIVFFRKKNYFFQRKEHYKKESKEQTQTIQKLNSEIRKIKEETNDTILQLKSNNEKLEKDAIVLQSQLKKLQGVEKKETTNLPPMPNNLRYADFIEEATGEFRNVTESAGAMANFVLEILPNGSTATFKVRPEAEKRVVDRPNYLAGCIKEITPGGTNFSQTEGKAYKQGDKWIVDENNKLKITIS